MVSLVMLRSTYTPSAAAAQPLPPGWTEHKAPTGHSYYYNASTQESTYTRPGAAASFAVQPLQSGPQLNLADPNVANAFMARHSVASSQPRNPRGYQGQYFRGGRGAGARSQPGRPQPHDKPTAKFAIPGCESWFLVFTKYGRRFAFNSAKNESFWRIPEKLRPGILELDQRRIREKAEAEDNGVKAMAEESPRDGVVGPAPKPPAAEQAAARDYDSSEYEEVEVTDDEDEAAGEENGGEEVTDDGASGDKQPKRPRLEQDQDDGAPAVEFNEADIAYQLQAMGEEYGLEQGEYDDGNMEDWPEGVEGLSLSDDDARALFKDLLDDFHINPYSPWEKLIEEGKVIGDSRYTVLGTMKARREVWEAWSRERIQELKEARSTQEKTDPRIPYLAFLQEKATPKLYWPEFKRKYRKEDALRDSHMADKEREKLYREYISRLKLPQSTLRSDLMALLRSLPLAALNNKTVPSHLPPQVLTDVRYISLDPNGRDALVEAYIQTLGPPPEVDAAAEAEQSEAAAQARVERRKREEALADRDRAVAEEKARAEKKLRLGQANLRAGERELQRAMHVGKSGLQSQLAADRDATR